MIDWLYTEHFVAGIALVFMVGLCAVLIWGDLRR